jgi:hypothetical protein
VDELCSCGHRGSHHAARLGTPGHGECTTGCGCEQFTWVEFITIGAVKP